MMYISSEHVRLLIEYGELDKSLGDDREVETEGLYQILDVLLVESTEYGKMIYQELMQVHHPDSHPFSITRPIDFPEQLTPGGNPLTHKLVRAPVGLVLVLNRDTALEPTKAGDHIEHLAPRWAGLVAALTTWDPAFLKARIGPAGWLTSVEIPRPEPPKGGPVLGGFLPPEPEPGPGLAPEEELTEPEPDEPDEPDEPEDDEDEPDKPEDDEGEPDELDEDEPEDEDESEHDEPEDRWTAVKKDVLTIGASAAVFLGLAWAVSKVGNNG